MLGNPKNLKSCISQDWDSCFLNNNLNIKKHGNKENLFTYAPKHEALPVRQPCGRPLRRNQHRTRHRRLFRPSLTPRRRPHEEIRCPFFPRKERRIYFPKHGKKQERSPEAPSLLKPFSHPPFIFFSIKFAIPRRKSYLCPR